MFQCTKLLHYFNPVCNSPSYVTTCHVPRCNTTVLHYTKFQSICSPFTLSITLLIYAYTELYFLGPVTSISCNIIIIVPYYYSILFLPPYTLSLWLDIGIGYILTPPSAGNMESSYLMCEQGTVTVRPTNFSVSQRDRTEIPVQKKPLFCWAQPNLRYNHNRGHFPRRDSLQTHSPHFLLHA